MADHPTEELNVGYVANEAQEQMLQDSAVETEVSRAGTLPPLEHPASPQLGVANP